MGKAKRFFRERIYERDFAWNRVYPALMSPGIDVCFNRTESWARKIQKILGGSKNVVYEVHGPDIYFIRSDLPKEQKEKILKKAGLL